MADNFKLLELQNVDMEKNVLGALFRENDLIDVVKEDLFTTSDGKEMLRAFKDLRKQGVEIDILVFTNYMQKNKMQVTLTTVMEIHNDFLSLTTVDTHIKILNDLATKRNIYVKTNSINYNKNYIEIIDEISRLCEEVYSIDVNRETTKEYYDEYLKLIENEKEEAHIKTGLTALDNDIVGFLNGQLITISAYTGMGKSVLISQLILNILKQDKKVLLFSLEMCRQEIINKLVANACSIEFNKIYKKKLSDEEKVKIVDFITTFLCAKGLEVYDTIGDINSIVSTIKRDKLRDRVDIVFIDLINRVSNNQSKNSNRAEFLGELTRKLKLIALQLNIPIVITCQINRVVEGRQDKRPTLADIKESGGIAEDSDLVIGLYRNKELEKLQIKKEMHDSGKLNYNSPNADVNPDAIEILLLKGRNVLSSGYSFNWLGNYQRICSWVR